MIPPIPQAKTQMGIVTESFVWQAGILAGLVFCMATWDTIFKRKEKLTLKMLKDSFLGIASMILVFAFISGGQGCHGSTGSDVENCQPSPHGMVCD